jgi:hypothetical protein
MTPEAKVKKRVRQILAELNMYYVMPATGGYGNSGAPDFICCLQGKFIGVECKARDNKPTALQLKNLQDIRNAGGFAIVINELNIDSLKLELEQWLRKLS